MRRVPATGGEELIGMTSRHEEQRSARQPAQDSRWSMRQRTAIGEANRRLKSAHVACEAAGTAHRNKRLTPLSTHPPRRQRISSARSRDEIRGPLEKLDERPTMRDEKPHASADIERCRRQQPAVLIAHAKGFEPPAHQWRAPRR